jgi:hypothetical protein
MKTLDFQILNETDMEMIGRVQLFEIGQLSPLNTIKGYFILIFIQV